MIELPQAVYDGLIDHAIDGAPEEVCGVLGGQYDDELTRVQSFWGAENASATPRSEYAIDPAEQLELIEAIEDDEQAVAGFYHSHPAGPPQPSATDAARATWPELSYVIVILDGAYPYVGSWRWDGDEETFVQEAVRKTD